MSDLSKLLKSLKTLVEADEDERAIERAYRGAPEDKALYHRLMSHKARIGGDPHRGPLYLEYLQDGIIQASRGQRTTDHPNWTRSGGEPVEAYEGDFKGHNVLSTLFGKFNSRGQMTKPQDMYKSGKVAKFDVKQQSLVVAMAFGGLSLRDGVATDRPARERVYRVNLSLQCSEYSDGEIIVHGNLESNHIQPEPYTDQATGVRYTPYAKVLHVNYNRHGEHNPQPVLFRSGAELLEEMMTKGEQFYRENGVI